MQLKDPQAFLHILDCAVQLDMPQLLACCEHFLAMDPSEQVDMAALAERLPSQSLLRIAKGSCKAFGSMRARVSKHIASRKSDCTCYYTQRYGGTKDYCSSCSNFFESTEDNSKYVPAPKQFLRMAQGLSVQNRQSDVAVESEGS